MAIRTSWTLLRPHVRPRLGAIAAVTVLGGLSAAFQTAVLLLFEPLWGRVLFPVAGGGGEAAGAGGLVNEFVSSLMGTDASTASRMHVLMAVTGIALVLAVVGGLTQFGFSWLSRRVAYQMVIDLRLRLANHLMGLSLRYHRGRRLGDLLSRISSDVGITLEAVNMAFKGLVREPLLAIGFLAVAAYAAPLPALIVLAALPLVALPVSRISQSVRRGSARSLDSLGSSMQALAQMFQGIRTVKAYRAEERELARYREINRTYFGHAMRMSRAIALAQSWTAFFGTAGIALLFLAVGWAAIQFGAFGGGGQLLIFFGAVAQSANHVKAMTRSWTRVQESVGACERLRALLDEEPDVIEAEDARPVVGFHTALCFENLTFAYPGSDAPALQDVDLEIVKGETVALVGPSGSGKSTMLDLIARFVDPTGGRITVDGLDLAGLSIPGWTDQVAMVGQAPFLFHASIDDNVRYGKPEASDEQVRQAVELAGLGSFLAALPDGIDTGVDDMGTRLSGGQRQRIEIARAFLKDAPLLLLDEPTSALDTEAEAEVLAALESTLAAGSRRTVVVVAHRLSTVRGADRIIVLEGGRIVESGDHDALVAAAGTYARLWEAQSPTGSRGSVEAPSP